MRFFLSIVFLLSLSSCGKEIRSTTSTRSEKPCVVNLLTNRCDPIQGTESDGVEILETVLEVAINIQGQEITFLSDKSSVSVGKKMTCAMNVTKDEVHRFALRGEKLLILSAQGSYEFENQSEEEGLGGHWVWTGYVNGGVLEIRQLSLVGKNRLILRKTCEL
jgi:hypothetical protein